MIAVTANLTSVLFTPVRDFKCVLSSLETSRADLSWPTHSTCCTLAIAPIERPRCCRCSGRLLRNKPLRKTKAAFLVDREQSHARAMPYEQLGVISTATTRSFLHFSRTLSVPCVQYPDAYASIYMYMGDNKRTFGKCTSFLPFIRVAHSIHGAHSKANLLSKGTAGRHAN